MKIKTVVFLYNVRHIYPDPNDYRNQIEGDFDDPITIKWQIKHLRNLGFKVYPIEADEKAYFKLYRLRKKIDLVFNIAEGLHGKDRELQIPAILEMLKIPYTGCSPLTQGLILDKAKAKEIFIKNKIPTLPFQIFKSEKQLLEKKLEFPLFVKPVAEGSSMGITNESVAYDIKELKKQTKKIINVFKEPALLEPYLEGREFSVAMLGNPPVILPIIESNHQLLPKKYRLFDSLEVKWYFEEQGHADYLICPAKIDKRLEKKIKNICFDVWDSLDVLDWCRIDIRCDKKGNPYVLEINSPPGIIPPEVSTASYFPLVARKAGIEYENLLLKIIETAIKRYG
ncbi:D-alanine--D-alanine ligase [Candidatus Roizmanbacteria bacterium CG22_combo_CG10-13_8_21_14_all_35_9]|uniref:D-alanine--D-alanine ligase n=1 Tax=Candidatus Roizmanbacteria bacterium CG22_combo_CG10-13_8_21_14_all_35_9 TaxID=1974861 RepID=A0A2H0BZ41_9BACT|nr:MAG: D-alanine--D-alanine ligase [Candidatus Roizmanbacteria bacterium CG22_combo_CG10-13_8_21_14_all_35_9]